MSIAGIRSNRGDGYQTMVALDWALTVLSDPDFEWIEIDSINWSVDDVVIGKRDGTIICCQCKKNQIDYRHWNITDLADEFEKAAELLSNCQQSQVRFYSRSPFGDIAKLREHSTTQSSDQSYYSNLSIALKKTDSSLSSYLSRSFSISTYQFLRRTHFEVSPELDRMQTLIRERLRYLTCHADIAFNTLWTQLDQFGARMVGETGLSAPVQHRLTKHDLQSLLSQSGAMLAPIMNLGKVRNLFESTSSIGRIWQRAISDIRVPNPVKNKLLAAIDAKERAILLTGLPGVRLLAELTRSV